MATELIIPELLNHYNVYNNAQKLIGVSGDVELPDFEAITETIEGAGVLGEIEAAATGQFSSMSVKIPFSVLYGDMFTLVNPSKGANVTLRGSMQFMNSATGTTDHYPVKVVIRGKCKKYSLGKMTKGKKMDPSVELEILYIKIDVNSKPVVELDKANFKYAVNGVDLLKKIRSQC